MKHCRGHTGAVHGEYQHIMAFMFGVCRCTVFKTSGKYWATPLSRMQSTYS